MTKAKIDIAVELNSSGARNAYGKISAAAKEMAHSSSNSTTVVSKASAILTQNIIGVAAAFATLRDASRAALLEKGLETQSARLGISLRSIAKDVQALTKYSINYRDAMEATSMVSSAGFGSDITRRLTKAAANSAIGLGRNMTDAMDRMIKGVVKLEPELLDELGIMTKLTEATSKYSRQTGKAESSLTSFEKRQAFLNAVLEESETKFGGLIDAIDTNPYDKLSASVVDLTRDGLNFLNHFLNPTVELLAESKPLLASLGLLLGSTMAKLIAPEMYNQAAEKIKQAENYSNVVKKQHGIIEAENKRNIAKIAAQREELFRAFNEAGGSLSAVSDERVRKAMVTSLQRSIRMSELALTKGNDSNKEVLQARIGMFKQHIDDLNKLGSGNSMDAAILNRVAAFNRNTDVRKPKGFNAVISSAIVNAVNDPEAALSNLNKAKEQLKELQTANQTLNNLALGPKSRYGAEAKAKAQENFNANEAKIRQLGIEIELNQRLIQQANELAVREKTGLANSSIAKKARMESLIAARQEKQAYAEANTINSVSGIFTPGRGLKEVSDNFGAAQASINKTQDIKFIREARKIKEWEKAGNISSTMSTNLISVAKVSAGAGKALIGVGLAARVAGTAFLNAIPIIGQAAFAISLLGSGVKMAVDYFHPAGKVISKATEDVKENIKTLQDVGKQTSSIFNMTGASAGQSAQAILGVSNAIGALAESYKTLQSAKINASKYDALNGPTKDSSNQGPTTFNKWFSIEYKSIKALRETGYAPLLKDIENITTNSELFNKSNSAGQRLIMGRAVESLGKKYANAGLAIQDTTAATKQLMNSTAEFTKASKLSTPYDSIAESLIATIQSVTNLRAEMLKGSITAEEFNKQLSSIAANPLLSLDSTRLQNLTESLNGAKDALKRQQDEMKAKYGDQEYMANSYRTSGRALKSIGGMAGTLGSASEITGNTIDYFKQQRPDYIKDAKIEKDLKDLQIARAAAVKIEQEAMAKAVSSQLTAQHKIVSQLQNQHALSAAIIELENTRFSKSMKYAQGTAAGIIMQAEHQNRLAAEKISQLDAEYALQARLHANTLKAAISEHDRINKNAEERLASIDAELKIQLRVYQVKENLDNASHESIMKHLNEQITAQQELLNKMSEKGFTGFWASITNDRTKTLKDLSDLEALKAKASMPETDKIISEGNFERAKQEAENALHAAENLKLQAKIARESMADMGDAIREARTQAAENVRTQLNAAIDNAKILLDISEQLAGYNTNSLKTSQQELYISKLKADNELLVLESKYKVDSRARSIKIKELSNSTIQNAATNEALRIAIEANKNAENQFNIEKERIKIGLYINWMEKARLDIYKEGLEIQQNQLSVYSKMLEMTHSIRDQEYQIRLNRMKLTNLRSGGNGEFSPTGQKFIDAAEANRSVLAARESYRLKLESIKLEYALLYAQQAALEGELVMRRQILSDTGQGSDAMFNQIDAALSAIRSVNINTLQDMAIANARNEVRLAGQNADMKQYGIFGDRSSGPKLGMTLQAIQEWLYSKDARNNSRDMLDKPISAVTYNKEMADKEINDSNNKIFSAIQSVKADPTKLAKHIKDITNAKATTTIWVSIASDISAIRSGLEKQVSTTSSNDIIDFGNWIKSNMPGWRISENAAFGKVNKVHGKNSAHYSGNAIDINYGYGGREWDNPKIRAQGEQIVQEAVRRGLVGLFGVKGHYDHIHAQSGTQGLMYKGSRLGSSYIPNGSLAANDNYTKSETFTSANSTNIGGVVKEILNKNNPFATLDTSTISSDLLSGMREVVTVVGDLSKSLGGLNRLTESQVSYLTSWATIYEGVNSEWVSGQGSAIEQLEKLGEAAGGLGPALAKASKVMLELFSPSGVLGTSILNSNSILADAKKSGIEAIFGPKADMQNQNTITAAMEAYKKEHNGSTVGFDAQKVGGMVTASDVASKALPSNKKLAESYGVLSTAASAFAAISSSISGILEANSNRRIANIDAEISAEQRRDGKSAQSLEKIKSLEAKKDAIARKQFEMNKKIQMAQTIINTASAVVGALAQGGPILGPILAGMIGALGAAQLAIISSTQYQSASASSSFTAPSLSIGKIGNSVDLGKGANANAGGEVGYLRGQTGTGNNANNYRTIGSAYGGNPLRGYGNRGIIVGEKGPERLEVVGSSAHITSNAELQEQSGTSPIVQHITIQALDSDSFTNFAKNNAGSLIEGIRHAANNQGQTFMENINTGAYKRKAAGRL